jgi:hypothetical protein
VFVRKERLGQWLLKRFKQVVKGTRCLRLPVASRSRAISSRLNGSGSGPARRAGTRKSKSRRPSTCK